MNCAYCQNPLRGDELNGNGICSDCQDRVDAWYATHEGEPPTSFWEALRKPVPPEEPARAFFAKYHGQRITHRRVRGQVRRY